jgi:hypothetical protein
MKRREFGASLAGATAAARAGWTEQAAEAVPALGSLTDVPGLKVGHFTDPRRPTGCTAILFDEPAAVGVDYDGSAPGESLVVKLQPISPVEKVHAMHRGHPEEDPGGGTAVRQGRDRGSRAAQHNPPRGRDQLLAASTGRLKADVPPR